MNHPELDEVDRGILHMLQEDARNNTAADIADAVGVAPNTVRNRMEDLEGRGIIRGYSPEIDYERAGYQLHVVFICTVPVSDRSETADDALAIEGVIQVVETLSGHHNLAVETVGEDSDDITAIATQLEGLNCKLEGEWFIKNARAQPFDHFGVEEASNG